MTSLKKIYFTSVKSGIRMSLQAWLEAIAEKDFGKEYCMMDFVEQMNVKFKFIERKKNGIFVEG